MLNLYPPANNAMRNNISLDLTPEIYQTCQAIYDACKGLGTDEMGLIAAFGTKSADQRNRVSVCYKELFGKDLTKVLKHDTSGSFGYLLQLIAQPLPDAGAAIIRKATKGVGTKEKLIYPIVMGRTNVEMQVLKKTYYDKYDKDLASVMDSDLSGDLKEIVLASLQASLQDVCATIHTPKKAEADAKALFSAGEDIVTAKHKFINILVTSPPQHLRAVNAAYVKQYKHNVIETVKKTFRGDAKDALGAHGAGTA